MLMAGVVVDAEGDILGRLVKGEFGRDGGAWVSLGGVDGMVMPGGCYCEKKGGERNECLLRYVLAGRRVKWSRRVAKP